MPVAAVTVSAASGISLASSEEEQRQELARNRPPGELRLTPGLDHAGASIRRSS
jgi:hypothetical protein